MKLIQYVNILVIIILGISLALIYLKNLDSKKKNKPIWFIFLVGLICALLGVVASPLNGVSKVDTLQLINTYGFGKAYVLGLGVILASILIFIFRKFQFWR